MMANRARRDTTDHEAKPEFEGKHESTPEPEATAEPETKPDPEAKPEPKPAPEPEAKPERRPKPKSEPEPEHGPEVEPEPTPEAIARTAVIWLGASCRAPRRMFPGPSGSGLRGQFAEPGPGQRAYGHCPKRPQAPDSPPVPDLPPGTACAVLPHLVAAL